MSAWDGYPLNYRHREVQIVVSSASAGECCYIVGLSGAGKSNLIGFLANRRDAVKDIVDPAPEFIFVDCNRLRSVSPAALFASMYAALGFEPSDMETSPDPFHFLERAIDVRLENSPGICFLIDRFEVLMEGQRGSPQPIYSNLRALRDRYKYQLTYTLAARKRLPDDNELAELFYANTIWVGPLGESDARWNVTRFVERRGLDWEADTVARLIAVSGGYPALLKAACEAHAAGVPPELEALTKHPAVRRRVGEFWADDPANDDLRKSGLEENKLLNAGRPAGRFDSNELTAKEFLLWEYLNLHAGHVCTKDALIRAVWPEDRIYERGIRDDSLAQLVRRLREKVENDPSAPRLIVTVPGRGYQYNPVQ